MADMNALLQLAQAAGLTGNGGQPPQGMPPMPPQGMPPTVANGNPMAAAVAARMNQPGYSPPVGMPPGGMPNTGDPMSFGQGQVTGPATDMDYMQVHQANQDVRGNLPPRPTNDYSGFGDEMSPMPEPRQTPKGAKGQPMSTEQELADVQRRMGGEDGPNASRTPSGDPSADGNFPLASQIRDLTSGKISPEEFDAQWGKGAAKEILGGGSGDDDGDMYEGDNKNGRY